MQEIELLGQAEEAKKMIKGFSHTGVSKFSIIRKQTQRSYSFDFFF